MAGLNYPAEGPPPPGDDVFDVTSSPSGGWTAQQTPRAVYYNGVTYFGFVNGSTGNIVVASYDHAAETTSTPFIIDTISDVDAHNAPALLIRDSDKRLMVFYCAHDGPNMWLRISTNPEDATAFGSATNLDSSIGASDYTYPQAFQLTGVTNDPIYLFYRDVTSSDGRLAYTKSTDDGATWSARTVVMTGTTVSNFIPYWYAGADTTTIDFVATDRDSYGTEGTVDVGHMYITGSDDKWYTSAGVEITATKPFAHSELTQLETNVTGALVFDVIAGANPVTAYMLDTGTAVTGRYARWDGAAWDKADIYTEDHLDVDRFYGYLAINKADPEEVFSGISTGTNTSELYTYVSADLGLTWDAGTAVTTGSADYNAGVTGVVNGDAGMPVIWLRGTITSSTDFAFGIKGLRR